MHTVDNHFLERHMDDFSYLKTKGEFCQLGKRKNQNWISSTDAYKTYLKKGPPV